MQRVYAASDVIIYTGGSTLASLLTLANKKSVTRTELVKHIEIEIKIKMYF